MVLRQKYGIWETKIYYTCLQIRPNRLVLPFLEKMFISEKPAVAARAAINPTTSKETSDTVATATPPTIGISDA